MENEIIIVKQLPIIEEQLLNIKKQFEDKATEALAMVCTEDTYKEIKIVRANMTKVYNDLEEKRIGVKKEILAPYNEFEKVYKECITEVYIPTKSKLDKKISEVEDGLKDKIKEAALLFYNEYITTTNIDFITFKSVGLNITMNASKKSLIEQIKTYIDKISDDLAMIETQEYKTEIMVEYKASLNAAQAITTISNRHKAIETERQRAEQAKAAAEAQAVIEQNIMEVLEVITTIEPITAPTVTQEVTTKLYAMTITVKGTLSQMKDLKQFLTDGGYEYEQHK